MKISGPFEMKRRPNNYRAIPTFRRPLQLGDASSVINAAAKAVMDTPANAAYFASQEGAAFADQVNAAANGNVWDELLTDPLNLFRTAGSNIENLLNQQVTNAPQAIQDEVNADAQLVTSAAGTAGQALGVNWWIVGGVVVVVAYFLLGDE
jgi:hypothetical protein